MNQAGRRGKGESSPSASLTGGGPSLLGISGSMRARDISRPRPDDMAAAEKLVQVSFRPGSTGTSTGSDRP